MTSFPHSEFLDDLFTEEEVKNLLKFLPKRKAPGPDGIPYELLKAHWRILGPCLLSAFHKSISSGLPLYGSQEGITVLIYKKGPPELLSNWRPITLLNTDYKLLSKLLASRISSAAAASLHLAQYGFLPGRGIQDNINMVANSLRDQATSGILAFLDQEKAYDRVSWPYLDACLEACSIPCSLRIWISSTLTGSSIKLALPAGPSNPVPLTRGLRQGDPLSPILYNISLDPFLRHLDQGITGLSTHSQQPLKVAAFADDCVVALSSKADSVFFGSCLATYSELSQAKINAEKSQAISLGTPGFKPPLGIRPSALPVRHLGALVKDGGFALPEMESRLLASVTSALAPWRCSLTSQIGRVYVVNTYAYSRVWFTAGLIPLSSSFFRQLNNIIQEFLWFPNRPPTTSQRLEGPLTHGGLGLINVKLIAAKTLAKSLLPVFLASTIPHWTTALRIQWCRALGLSPSHKPHTLNNWLSSHPTARGPQGMDPYWKALLSFFHDHWSLASHWPPTTRGRGRATLEWTPIFRDIPCPIGYQPQLSRPPVQEPEVLEILPGPYPEWPLKAWWLCAHSSPLPPWMRTNTWKILRRVYRTADRGNCVHPSCSRCGQLDTLEHRFFLCSSSKAYWKAATCLLLPLRPMPSPWDNGVVDWFFNWSAYKAPSSFGHMLFPLTLWCIHAATLRSFSSPDAPPRSPAASLYRRLSWLLAQVFFPGALSPALSELAESWRNLPFLVLNTQELTVTVIPPESPSLPPPPPSPPP